jgi:peptidoglycan/LPS O-acetylase OafA/YrhL
LSPPPLPPRPNAAPAGPTNRSWTDCARWPSWACFATTVGALAFSCPLVARWLRYFPQTNPWIATIEIWEAVFIGWIIAATAQGWTGWPGRFLSWPPLVYIGKISLGVYLYHVLVPITLGPSLDRAGITAAAHNTLRVWLLAGLSIGAPHCPGTCWKNRWPSSSRACPAEGGPSVVLRLHLAEPPVVASRQALEQVLFFLARLGGEEVDDMDAGWFV